MKASDNFSENSTESEIFQFRDKRLLDEEYRKKMYRKWCAQQQADKSSSKSNED